MRLALLLALFGGSILAAERPNIVFIFTDDQAPWALGASGHRYADTPNLDRLFASGAYLTNAFTVTPVCSPSRASLMTSRYGSELGITDWIHPRREPQLGLDPATATWPEAIQASGYRTGLVGKWHLGLPDRFHPTRTGFDYFMGIRGGGTTPSDPMLEKDGVESRFEGFTPDILTDHALSFLEAEQEGPFLLALHFRAPHARWLPVRDEDWAPFDELDPEQPHPDYPDLDVDRVKRMTREYLASVKSVDRNVGRVVAELERLGLSDRTIIIFSSDHGYNVGHNGIWHKGNGHWVLSRPPAATANIPEGQRPNMYDTSIKVPTAVVWPGVVAPGTVLSRTVSNLDWFPTLLEMAEIDAVEPTSIRGRSIVPLLKGEPVSWNDEFYGEYSTHHQSRTDMRMYRTPRWKLIRDFLDPERDELYDLENDPEERRNLVASDDAAARGAIKQLDAKIRERMRSLGDPVLRTANATQSTATLR